MLEKAWQDYAAGRLAAALDGVAEVLSAPETPKDCYILLADILRGMDKPEIAEYVLVEAYSRPDSDRLLLEACALRWKLEEGDGKAALGWLQAPASNLPVAKENAYLQCTTIKAYLVIGALEAAIELSERLSLACAREDLLYVSAQIFLSLALRRKKKRALADAALERAALRAQAKEIALPFLLEGAETAAPLHRLHLRLMQGNAGELQTAFVKKLYLAALRGGKRQKQPLRPVQLSARQKEILALLAEGCLYREIAETTGLSVPTVKGYLRIVYEKLQAANRRDAVEKAEALGLL